jgi:uncharacterized delta-60 repeat protein
MAQAFRKVLVHFSFIVVFTSTLGCGGNGETQPDLQSSSSSHTGRGFNQARGFNGPVRSIIPVPNGNGDVYVSGDFTTYGESTVAPVVRLRFDGSINRSFTLPSSINNRISSIALADDGSGDLYVADYLVEQSAAPHTGTGRIWKIHADGAIDGAFVVGTIIVTSDSFPSDPIFRAVVRNIVPVGDGSGRVYVAVGGLYNGVLVGSVVRLNPNGSLDTTFISQTLSRDVFLVVPANDESGNIYVATYRRDDPNTWVSYLLLRLHPDGSLDSDFDTGVRGSPEARISRMVPVGDGSGDLFAIGVFPNFADPLPFVNAFRGLVRIDSSGTIDVISPKPRVDSLADIVSLAKADDGSGDWIVGQAVVASDLKVLRYKADGTLNPMFATAQLRGTLHDIVPARDGSGDLYYGGDFRAYNSVGVNYLARVNSDGSLDSGTVVGSGLSHSSLPVEVAAARDGSGQVFVAGMLSSYNGAAIPRLARLNGDGRLDSAWSDGRSFEGLGVTPHLLPTVAGPLYVAAGLVSTGAEPSRQLIRLLPDGREDAGFSIGTGFTPIGAIASLSLAEDDSQDLYVAGTFDLYQGAVAPGLVRVHADGSRDRQFAPALSRGIVTYVAATADGSGTVYVIADPGSGLSQPMRLQRNGSIDTGFAVPEPYRTHAAKIVPLKDGSGDLLILSIAQNGDLGYESRVVRLHPNGTIDEEFNVVTLDGFVHDMVLVEGTSSDVYVGGSFIRVNGTVSPGIVRIDRNGNLDASFLVGQGFDDFVWSIDPARDGSGDIFVGGSFTRYKSTTMQGIARLHRDGSAD